ncbi:MAG: hypothetical protein ACYCVL_13795 [Gemmatimonadaceae bacterium]
MSPTIIGTTEGTMVIEATGPTVGAVEVDDRLLQAPTTTEARRSATIARDRAERPSAPHAD